MDIYKLNFTKLEIEILSYLSFKVGEKLSQRDIAIALNVSPTAISNAVKNLQKKDLIKIDVTKSINFVSYNRENLTALRLKRIENLKMIDLSGLSDYLEEKFPGSTIILFGSYSKGEDTMKSDIDIAIIGAKEKNINLENFEKKFNKKININCYNSWKNIHYNLKNNILNGIVLHGGIEL